MIRFSKYIYLYFIISAIVLIPGMFTLLRFGLRQSIDFTGGTLVEVSKQGMPAATVEGIATKAQLPVASIQETQNDSIIFRLQGEKDIESYPAFYSEFQKETGKSLKVLSNETVGPVLGSELLRKAQFAALIAILGILLYVAYAFKNVYFGISAVVALIHDLLVVVGIFAILGQVLHVEVDTLFVTAFLTTMSFSVHDTIVVFDRIREMQKKGERGTFEELADKAMTQTISRSVANSFTIIIMLLALFLLGGTSVHWFVFALLIGTVSGTYSSPFIATPVLIFLKRWEKQRKARK